jgi:hypothetical protein
MRTAKEPLLVVAVLIAASVFVLTRPSGAAPEPEAQPFANAVQQRAEMIRELKEIKFLLKEQNTLLREAATRAGKS